MGQIDAITEQRFNDYEHIVIWDDSSEGIGMHQANLAFHNHRHRVSGRYVIMLDDDDILPDSFCLTDMMAHLQAFNEPDVLVVSGRFAEHGVLPSEACFSEKVPLIGHISGQNIVCSYDVWTEYVQHFQGGYTADWNFIKAVWKEDAIRKEWTDNILVGTQQVGLWRPE